MVVLPSSTPQLEPEEDSQPPKKRRCQFYNRGLCMFGAECRYEHVACGVQRPDGFVDGAEALYDKWDVVAGIKIIIDFDEGDESLVALSADADRIKTGPMRLRVLGTLASLGGIGERLDPQNGVDLCWDGQRWTSLLLPGPPEQRFSLEVVRLEQSDEHPGSLEGFQRTYVHGSRRFTHGPRHVFCLPPVGQVLEIHTRAPTCLSSTTLPATRLLPRAKVSGFDAMTIDGPPSTTLRCGTFDAPSGPSLGFSLYLPPGYRDAGDAWPLLVFLHAMHGRLDGDNNLFYESDTPLRLLLGDRRCPKALREQFVVLSPQCPADNERDDNAGVWLRKGWFESSEYDPAIEHALKALIQESVCKLRVDRRRVVVVGSSMGAYAALELSARWPGAFAAGALVASHYDLDPIGPLIDRVAAQQLPLWFVHARNDCWCPFEPVRQLVEALRERSAHVRFTEFVDEWSNTGHSADRVAFWSSSGIDGVQSVGDELFAWLAKQQGPGSWKDTPVPQNDEKSGLGSGQV